MSRISVALTLAGALLLGVPAGGASSAHAFDWLGHIALDADGLSSPDPQTRLASVRALARYDIEWTREHLLGALSDPDVHVRSAAGRALARHGEKRALPTLIKWLAMPDAQSKQVGAAILGEMRAQAAVPALVRALGDSDPVVRSNSLVALGTIGGDAVIVPLVTRLEDDKADVRLVAVQQLQTLGDTRAVIPLVGLFRDSSQTVRIGAIGAIGSLGDASATAALLRELGDRDDAVKLAAITALGTLKARGALSELIAVMSRGNTAMRSKAAFSLAQIAKAHPEDPLSPEAIAGLVEALAESAVRNAAREALRTAGTAAVPHLIAHLDGERQGHPASAIELLEEIGDVTATPALVRELSRERIPQATVLRALSSLGDARALLPILALLDDPSPIVRLGAMKSLGPLLSEQSAAADIMVDRLADRDPEIRLLASRFLGQMRARSAVPNLIAIAEDNDDFALRATALIALGRIGDTSASPIGLKTLSSKNPALRALAADLLAELGDPKTVGPLLKMARQPDHISRSLAIESLGGVLRGKENANAASILLGLAKGPNQTLGLAAIEALSGIRDSRTGPALTQLLQSTDSRRRAAAAHALGEMRYQGASKALRKALQQQPSRIGAAAAWALGQIGDRQAAKALLLASQRRGTARAVNASAALAAIAAPSLAEDLRPLLLHANALVRINAITALSRAGAKDVAGIFERMLERDTSVLVRIAAARALSAASVGAEALKRASVEDDRREVREAAAAGLETPFQAAAESRWAVFRIVDPLRDDSPVAHESRFFVRADGIAIVDSTDQRGRIYSQNFPEGPFTQGALSSLSGY